jgi:hypothetical protein
MTSLIDGRCGCNNRGRIQSKGHAGFSTSDLGFKTFASYPGVKSLADFVVAPFDTLATVCDTSGINDSKYYNSCQRLRVTRDETFCRSKETPTFRTCLNQIGLFGFASIALQNRKPDPGGITEGSQGVADLMSPGEIESKTPGKSKIVLSPRSLLSALPGERLGERPRRRRSGGNSNLLETFRATKQKGVTRW